MRKSRKQKSLTNAQKEKKDDEILQRLYYDLKSPSSFSTAEKLHAAVNGRISLEKIKEWLRGQLTYTLHRPIRKTFQKNQYVLSNINEQLQSDLGDLSSLSEYNDGYRYILLVIDSFSKFIYLRPLKTKSSGEVLNAFKSIMDKFERPVEQLITDRGKEYLNKSFSKYLKSKGTIHILPSSDTYKASLAERGLKTIKGIIHKYLTSKMSLRYIDVLQDVAYTYNHRIHSTINKKPAEVNDSNIYEVWSYVREKRKRIDDKQKPSMDLKVGDHVRVAINKSSMMEKGFLPNYTDEIFTIVEHIRRKPDVYRLRDKDGTIEGVWYRKELQKVRKDDETLYRIEKIIKRQKKKGIVMCLVKWKNLHKSNNSWVRESDIVGNYE